MADSNPVFDSEKPFASHNSISPTDEVAFIQYGAQFGSDEEFLGYMEGYDPERHSEKPKNRKAQAEKPKTRSLKTPKAPGRRTKKTQQQQEVLAELNAETEAAEHSGVGD